MGKPEGAVEKFFRDQAIKHNFMCFKFRALSIAGVPDRIIIGHGLTIFVELKAPGETPRPLQLYTIGEMRSHGALVDVLESKPQVKHFFESFESQEQDMPKRIIGKQQRQQLAAEIIDYLSDKQLFRSTKLYVDSEIWHSESNLGDITVTTPNGNDYYAELNPDGSDICRGANPKTITVVTCDDALQDNSVVTGLRHIMKKYNLDLRPLQTTAFTGIRL